MNRIKQLRTQKSIKQLDLCKSLGISQGTLSAWETGRWEPDIKSLLKICDIFDCTADYLLARAETNKFVEEHENNRLTISIRGSNRAPRRYVLNDLQVQAVEKVLEAMNVEKE